MHTHALTHTCAHLHTHMHAYRKPSVKEPRGAKGDHERKPSILRRISLSHGRRTEEDQIRLVEEGAELPVGEPDVLSDEEMQSFRVCFCVFVFSVPFLPPSIHPPPSPSLSSLPPSFPPSLRPRLPTYKRPKEMQSLRGRERYKVCS